MMEELFFYCCLLLLADNFVITINQYEKDSLSPTPPAGDDERPGVLHSSIHRLPG